MASASLNPNMPAPVPFAVLSGHRLETYLTLLDRLLDAGRLNKFYPDPSELRHLYRFMRPSENQGLYPSLKIDLRTGMPMESEVSRVMTDADLAHMPSRDRVSDSEAHQLTAAGSEAGRRRLQRSRYHDALSTHAMPSAFGLYLALRRVDTATRTAYFTVTFDRFDLSDGIFVRYTIQLAQTDSRWTRPQVELVGDDLQYTANFRNVISRFTADEAEFAFLLLSDLRHVQVEDVIRGRVGPLYFRGMQLPKAWEPLFEAHKSSFLMHFPSERAGQSVSQEGSNDPIAMLYREFLSSGAREGVEARRQQLNYKVWKERKFSATPALVDPLKRFLLDKGYRCLIQSVVGPVVEAEDGDLFPNSPACND